MRHTIAGLLLTTLLALMTGCGGAEVGGPASLPAAAWLLLSGLAGFGFVARRRTAA